MYRSRRLVLYLTVCPLTHSEHFQLSYNAHFAKVFTQPELQSSKRQHYVINYVVLWKCLRAGKPARLPVVNTAADWSRSLDVIHDLKGN